MQPSPTGTVRLVSARYNSMSEILYTIQKLNEDLKNEFNQFQGVIPHFESRFSSHKKQTDMYQIYFEFVLTNEHRTWT